ncbi:MAG: HAD-IA family hydrolase [Patescibacteria group bacterium]
MSIRFILSDIGDVLVRIRRFHREEQLAKRYGLDQQEVRQVVYFEGERMRAFERGDVPWHVYREVTLQRLAQIGAQLEPDAPAHFTRIWRELLQEPILPVARLWMALGRHMNIVSASNIDSQSYESGVAPHPMVANLFHHHTHSYRLGRRKGDPDYFIKLRRQLGAQPEQCFFVDDMPEHVTAARAHGIPSFCFDKIDAATICELKARLIEAGVPSEFVTGSSFNFAPC